jgi:prepilin-type N-terminal cleavage/methylation domain-containing protein/prepilin-type processing-associated H-X9-DG protein
MIHHPPNRREGFTLMEVLVVVAIILVLAAILVPAVAAIQQRANKTTATARIRDLCAGAQAYSADNNDELPQEDVKGTDSWAAAQDPANGKAWYNALPKAMGKRNVADFASTPRAFYTKDNILFLPGATYPDSERKLVKPLFAIGINNKLQKKDPEGKKPVAKRSQITNPTRTPLFLEQGLPGESKGAPMQSKKDFDGAPKASAHSMPGRYGGKGIIGFVDGHVEEWFVKDLLTETNMFPFPPTDVIWMKTPEEDPNK